ncbi:unnamed protein product [Citrullus colocynthis]|uniref:Bifunctional inhibitor/plant lipid transfer protein/seed storage helical domain-containing protein n=1 Tax=Citrullus colocynthis TaxID=252529 RepID=A0ABP0ZA88_9ROSI
MAASPTKLPLVLLLYIAILASLVTARPGTVAAPTPNPLVKKDCISFVPVATKCVIDVLKNVVAPHPSCCEAISKLYDCSFEFLKEIPAGDKILVKSGTRCVIDVMKNAVAPHPSCCKAISKLNDCPLSFSKTFHLLT